MVHCFGTVLCISHRYRKKGNNVIRMTICLLLDVEELPRDRAFWTPDRGFPHKKLIEVHNLF